MARCLRDAAAANPKLLQQLWGPAEAVSSLRPLVSDPALVERLVEELRWAGLTDEEAAATYVALCAHVVARLRGGSRLALDPVADLARLMDTALHRLERDPAR